MIGKFVIFLVCMSVSVLNSLLYVLNLFGSMMNFLVYFMNMVL